MGKLFELLLRARVFVVFLLLEGLSVWAIYQNNSIHNADYFSLSSELSGSVLNARASIEDYMEVNKTNKQLIKENTLLQKNLLNNHSIFDPCFYPEQFEVISAKVVNNTFRNAANYLLISLGKKDGVEPGMGVISANGVVGQVKIVSKNFSVVYSLLHPKLMISSFLKKNKTLCTVQWDGKNYWEAALKYLPKHVKLTIGDTIVTSGFNAVFPENIRIGIVSEIQLEDHMTFYEAKVKLKTDFTSLENVYVIKNKHKRELDSLIIQ